MFESCCAPIKYAKEKMNHLKSFASRATSRLSPRPAVGIAAALLMNAAVSSVAPVQVQAATATKAAPVASWNFEYQKDDFKPDALLDLRYLNEKEAGASGFIKLSSDGNSFAFGDGRPARFWAVVSDGYRFTPEEMAQHARFLAKRGVNMVRLHTQIAPDVQDAGITSVNQKEIDGIWRFVAALKKEGIYSTISPYWATGKKLNAWGIEGHTGESDLWGVLFFNPKLQAGYKAWVKALYSPKNPYTGIPLSQDPAVGLIQVQNEDSLFFWTTQGMKPQQLEILGRKFGTWLVAKYGSLDKAKEAWQGAGDGGDKFGEGVAAILPTWQLTLEQSGGMAVRVADQVQFMAETQHNFYRDIAQYYRKDLGCKQLINASNWITADPIKLNDIERWTYTANDVLAVNKYTGGVHTGEANGWRIDPGHFFTDESRVLDPRELPTNLKQVAGHPMIITESSWVAPNGYQSEGPFMMAAYQSLTGVDAFYWFDASQPEYETHPYFDFLNFNGQHPMYKWTASTPELVGNFPAPALIYRLGYVKAGAPVVHEERPLKDLWNRQTPIIAEDKSFDPNRNTGNSGAQSNIARGVDPFAFLVGPVEESFGGDASKTRVIDLKPYIDRDKKIVKSVTGEINLNYGLGVCTLNTPKAQGATGFLQGMKTIKLKDVSLMSGNEYATVAVVAMDDKPLKTSGKILVQVGTIARPTGWKDEAAEFKSDDGKQTFQGFKVVNTGTMPYQIQGTDVSLEIGNAIIKKATLLDTSGYAVQELKGASKNGRFSLKLPNNAMYVVLQ